MARMPFQASGSAMTPYWESVFRQLFKLPLIIGGLFGVAAPAIDVFQAQIPSSFNAGQSQLIPAEGLPFDHVEFDLATLTNPKRKIEVKLWKDQQIFRPKAKFTLLPFSFRDSRLILRYRDKNEEIVLYVDPNQRRILKIDYRKEQSIGDLARNVWNWFTRNTSPPLTVVLSEAETSSVVATEN